MTFLSSKVHKALTLSTVALAFGLKSTHAIRHGALQGANWQSMYTQASAHADALANMNASDIESSTSPSPSTIVDSSTLAPVAQASGSFDVIGNMTNKSTNDTLPPDMAYIDSSGMGFCEDEGNREWHGQCLQCPSAWRTRLYPLAMLLFLAIIISLLHYLPNSAIDILWIGLDYCQLLYLLSIATLPWNDILEEFQNVLSIFALDLDATFSLQCLIGLSPHAEKVWSLLIPLLLGLFLSILSHVCKEMPKTVGWIATGVYLGYVKLILTSLEAIQCTASSPSWFCKEHTTTESIGIAGLVLYGSFFPLWLLWNLQRTSRREYDDKDSKLSGSEWAYNYPFHATLWWWAAVWLLRKVSIVVVMIVFPDAKSLVLLAITTSIVVIEIFQRYYSPFPQQDISKQKSTFGHASVDTTLRACLLIISALSYVLMADMKGSQRFALRVLFLFVLAFGWIYWAVAIVANYHVSSALRNEPQCTMKHTTNERLGYQSDEPNVTVEVEEVEDIEIGLQDESCLNSGQEVESAHPCDHVMKVPSEIMAYVESNDRGDGDDDDDDEADMATVYSSRGSNNGDDETLLEEIWIDEASGLPVENPDNGEWIDAKTGHRVEFGSSPVLRSSFTWAARRLSSVYKAKN